MLPTPTSHTTIPSPTCPIILGSDIALVLLTRLWAILSLLKEVTVMMLVTAEAWRRVGGEMRAWWGG